MTTIMNNLEERDVCRLCLEAAFGYCLSITEEVASDISDVLLSYLDFHISDNPGMCKQCEENLHKAVSFKSSRKMLLSPYTGGAESTDTKQCNFCISYPVQVRPVPDAGNNVFLLEILREIGKKLKTVSTDNPVACDSCFCIIQDILQFTKTCLKTEEKIRKYIEIEGLNPNGKVDLDDVQTFATKSIKWGFNELEVTEADVTKTILEKSNIDNMNYISTNSTEVNNVDGTYAETKLEVMNNFSVKEEVCEEGKLEFNENEKSVTLTVNNSAKKIHLIPTENLKIENNSEEIYIKEEEMEIKSEDDFDSFVPKLVPEKSRKKYLKAFKRYEKWCLDNKICNITNEKELLVYFKELSIIQKPTSLWWSYTMLRTEIALKRNVDIKKCTDLLAFLRKNLQEYRYKKKSKRFTKQEIATFLLTADDRKFLCMKVVFIIGLAGACSREELANLLVENVKDEGICYHITIPNTTTKASREFFVTAGNIDGLNLVEVVRKYVNLRHRNCDHGRFFLRYKYNQCMKYPIGINALGAVPKSIAQFLRLPDPKAYTTRCFRLSSRSLFTDFGVDPWKS